jgi:energy-coupling factor transporter ATP-binding protein EcfA2
MRLQSIYLKEYRVIRDLLIEFEQKTEVQGQENVLTAPSQQAYALDLIVGLNGVGKSTFLLALADLFHYLDMPPYFPPFGFEIKYLIAPTEEKQTSIFISNLDQETQEIRQDRRLRFRIDESPEILVDRVDALSLPRLVVAFTTGSEQEWNLYTENRNNNSLTERPNQPPHPQAENLEKQLVEWYLRELSGKLVIEQEKEERKLGTSRFLFISANYLPLVILCGLLVDMNQEGQLPEGNDTERRWPRLQRALKESRIQALRGFSLKFRMNRDLVPVDDRFFIESLAAFAHHTIQQGSDYLMVFDLTTIFPKKLIEVSGDGIQLFRTLVHLTTPRENDEPILREVNLFIERSHTEPYTAPMIASPLHLLDWFSDGEKSFLGRLCLLSLLSNNEALILLDEPEVHFNDYWKRQLVAMIDDTIGGQRSHILMTTHSSITLSDVFNRDIWILKRNNSHTNEVLKPNLSTLGADPSDIAVYVFGAESATGAQSTTYIEREIRRISSTERESAYETRRCVKYG